MKSLNELATITKCVMIDIKDIYVPYGEFMSKKFIQKFTLLHCYVHNVKTHTYSHVRVCACTHMFSTFLHNSHHSAYQIALQPLQEQLTCPPSSVKLPVQYRKRGNF